MARRNSTMANPDKIKAAGKGESQLLPFAADLTLMHADGYGSSHFHGSAIFDDGWVRGESGDEKLGWVSWKLAAPWLNSARDQSCVVTRPAILSYLVLGMMFLVTTSS